MSRLKVLSNLFIYLFNNLGTVEQHNEMNKKNISRAMNTLKCVIVVLSTKKRNLKKTIGHDFVLPIGRQGCLME